MRPGFEQEYGPPESQAHREGFVANACSRRRDPSRRGPNGTTSRSKTALKSPNVREVDDVVNCASDGIGRAGFHVVHCGRSDRARSWRALPAARVRKACADCCSPLGSLAALKSGSSAGGEQSKACTSAKLAEIGQRSPGPGYLGDNRLGSRQQRASWAQSLLGHGVGELFAAVERQPRHHRVRRWQGLRHYRAQLPG